MNLEPEGDIAKVQTWERKSQEHAHDRPPTQTMWYRICGWNALSCVAVACIFTLTLARFVQWAVTEPELPPSDAQSIEQWTQVAAPGLGHAPSPKLFILLTTQRSGSTWVCSLLRSQDSLMCGLPKEKDKNGVTKGIEHNDEVISEMMIKYSFRESAARQRRRKKRGQSAAMANASGRRLQGKRAKRKQIEDALTNQSQWELDADEQFQLLLESYLLSRRGLSDGQSAIGFKLMYDQVTDHGKFVYYLKRNDIAVIHLVREASVLILASTLQTNLKAMHMTNATEAELSQRETPAVILNTKSIKANVRAMEKETAYWVNRLKYHADIKYYYVSYEQMLSPFATDHLGSISTFLTGHSSKTSAARLSVLNKLHESTCHERIANFPEVEAAIRGTNALQACKYLDMLFPMSGNVN